MSQPARPFDQVQAILFDLDGTLVETDNRWAANLTTRLEPIRRLFPRFDTRAWGRRIVMWIEGPSNYAMSVVEHLGLSSSFFGLADRLRKSKGLATRAASEPVEGTEALLAALQPRYRLAVVTTRARPEAMGFLRQLKLEGYFPVVVTRQDVLRMKPHAEPVRKAAKLLGVPPQHCLMVGDTTMDILAGRRAGALTVAVLSGFGEREELVKAGADLILERACEIERYLSNH